MRVLVLGATGFIGFPVAQALVRNGHIVYGLTRSDAKSKELQAEEIIPIVGDPAKPKEWLEPLMPTLDCLVDTVGGSAEINKLQELLIDTAISLAKATRPAGSPKLSFIETSGTWVHGDDNAEIKSDSTPLTTPQELTQWRLAIETKLTQSTELNGTIIRPSLLYGRSGSLLATAMQSASKGKVSWIGTPDQRLATIHTDDLADLYLRAAENPAAAAGRIFDGTNDYSVGVADFLQVLQRTSKAEGEVEYQKPSNAFESALASSAVLRPHLGRVLLGWHPKKASLVDGIDVYYAACLAAQ
ncbi:uncharacterized protein L969DRAFT_19907 [Mixia osmundae IAM 14324]|uniref:NAD-dependent epimerase/dehydratase domain-containing protein n=1 Tax=Mixia osmundae (strain CBS 9802 / IAM 14324 / JCM 22182 / KY 12970) TaxID=764103 RepID=G7E2H7_MIXOS|nr:uncharacterized protein L969DRAFT_19907 [Mixia osmundae IAM 14324]KEI36909.1 hypothetical protein L969DRAFT_19907 [Mixia osmundae IAM 14324]GAA97037.1 hypothetical protein E5Q_03712 [Mixia osmundae IAM 14324]